jgi:hypothetical protein
LEINSKQNNTRDVVVNALIINENTGTIIDGFELRTLTELKGKASYSATWNNAKLEPGNYIIIVELRDLKGVLLDKKVENIRLGKGTAKVLSLDANPKHHQSGDSVLVNMMIENSGNTHISGTAIIQILNSADIIQKYENTFSDLIPSETIKFTNEWEIGTADNTIKIVGYIMFEGITTPPVIEYISLATPTPSPTPSPEPSPSPEPESPRGISGFPLNSIIIGVAISTIIIEIIRIRHFYSHSLEY